MKKFFRAIRTSIFFSLLSFHLMANSWPVPFFEGSLVDNQEGDAVILGAGPAGMMAANIALKSGLFKRIIIVEMRSEFSRFNLVNFFPENWPMLTTIGVADDFRAVGHRAERFSLYMNHFDKELIDFETDATFVPENFDYRGPMSQIYEQHSAGLFILNLADLQHQLATSLARHDNVFFVQGSAEFFSDADTEKATITITSSNDTTYYLKPEIIVIAEGAHSASRKQLGIKLIPKIEQQWWCSGSVSLKNIWENGPKIMQVMDQKEEHSGSIRTFGIFNLRPKELFLNGQAFSSLEDVDDCLIRNAQSLIKFRAQKGDVPKNLDLSSLTVEKKSQGIISITPSIAEYFSSKNNVIIYGDAAGFGTPKGGIGFSMITGPYPQALLDLLSQWSDASQRKEGLEKYALRVQEIVDYWHMKTGSVQAK
ncbi:MAG: 3-(3-hydroxyphenyl)propionate hydroxylase [bacterium ADurb.BinA186]|nr:MAG: 3-(3-hydroxyphenyl)propionate hydroxylase [bacterium ADurb.BinA186]